MKVKDLIYQLASQDPEAIILVDAHGEGYLPALQLFFFKESTKDNLGTYIDWEGIVNDDNLSEQEAINEGYMKLGPAVIIEWHH